MASNKVVKMVITSVMMALVFVGTRLIQIGTPTGGYIHLGDGFVFLSGVILGPLHGMVAGGVGSMLTDLLSGYSHYALITLIVKGLAAFIVGIFSKVLISHYIKDAKSFTMKKNIILIMGCVIGGIIIVLGYFLFECFALELGVATALLGVYTNIVQVSVGVVVAILFSKVVNKIPILRDNTL